MADEGVEDYIFYGTPIEREEDLTGRKRKMSVEMGQIRRLPPWQQEVTDEEGRRRFHGAFTGGFSAGFYNTVGSKEGWAPQTFTSSRKKRADVKGQTIYNFLDDDEKAELEARDLSTSSQFDTFGFTAADIARKQAEKELQKRPSAIPGPVPDEIIVPVAESIGVKLLLKMGWRHGLSVGAGCLASVSDCLHWRDYLCTERLPLKQTASEWLPCWGRVCGFFSRDKYSLKYSVCSKCYWHSSVQQHSEQYSILVHVF